MTKSVLGRLALGTLALGVASLVLGVVFDEHGGHPAPAGALLAMFLLLPLGLVFTVAHFVVDAFRRAHTPLTRAAVGALGAGLGLMGFAALSRFYGRPPPAPLVVLAFALVTAAIVLRVVDRVRRRG